MGSSARDPSANRVGGFLLYLISFFAAWTAWVLWFYPRLQQLDSRSLAYAIVNLTTRGAIWVAPVFAYVRYVERCSPIAYLKLTGPWRRGVAIGLLVGVIEEIPFRGLIFRKLLDVLGPASAVVLSALLFTAIHLPGWISLGTLRAGTAVTIFVIGLVLAGIVHWSGSLWSGIVAQQRQ